VPAEGEHAGEVPGLMRNDVKERGDRTKGNPMEIEMQQSALNEGKALPQGPPGLNSATHGDTHQGRGHHQASADPAGRMGTNARLSSFLSHDHCPGHVRVDAAVVIERARVGELPGILLVGIEWWRGE